MKKAALRRPSVLHASMRGTGQALAAIAVGIARHRTLDVVPAITHSTLGLTPSQARLTPSGVPVAFQAVLHIIKLLALVLAVARLLSSASTAG